MNDPTMTEADLVEEVIRMTELPRKESEAIVETIFDSIISALQTGDKMETRGFGSFRTRQRRGRMDVIPRLARRCRFRLNASRLKPSKGLKDFVNTNSAHA